MFRITRRALLTGGIALAAQTGCDSTRRWARRLSKGRRAATAAGTASASSQFQEEPPVEHLFAEQEPFFSTEWNGGPYIGSEPDFVLRSVLLGDTAVRYCQAVNAGRGLDDSAIFVRCRAGALEAVRRRMPPDWRNSSFAYLWPKVRETSAPLAANTARVLADLWTAMLNDARPYGGSGGLYCGGSSHFAHQGRGGSLWTLEASTTLESFRQVANELRSVAEGGSEAGLLAMARALLDRLPMATKGNMRPLACL